MQSHNLAKAMFFHHDVLLFIDLWETPLSNLFDGVGQSWRDFDRLENLREISLPNPGEVAKMIQGFFKSFRCERFFLGLLLSLIFKLLLFLLALNFMFLPVFLLTLDRTIVDCLASSTSRKIICFPTVWALFLTLCLNYGFDWGLLTMFRFFHNFLLLISRLWTRITLITHRKSKQKYIYSVQFKSLFHKRS